MSAPGEARPVGTRPVPPRQFWLLALGYGVRRLDAAERVDADTIFQLGSVGKAFTTAALAVLVDRGEIAWDDRVIDHMPWFQMYDPWVTREMTIRDLLVHRSGLGLGAGDLLFVPRSSLSREETVRRLRFIRPATSFRSGYAYDNILYAVAGQLIEDAPANAARPCRVAHDGEADDADLVEIAATPRRIG